MNTSIVRAEAPRPHAANPTNPNLVKVTFKSGQTILLETIVSFPSPPALGESFNIDHLTAAEQDVLSGISRQGYLYKIGCSRGGLPEVEIELNSNLLRPESEITLNSSRIPYPSRTMILGYLERELGACTVNWQAGPDEPLVLALRSSGQDPSIGDLSEGIQAMLACPLSGR